MPQRRRCIAGRMSFVFKYLIRDPEACFDEGVPRSPQPPCAGVAELGPAVALWALPTIFGGGALRVPYVGAYLYANPPWGMLDRVMGGYIFFGV
jgi:hypothetical protein